MDHKTKTFQFADNSGKLYSFHSKRYNFKIEKILENRFGKEVLDEFNKTHQLNFNLTLEQAAEDMPKLLENVPDDFDWSEPSYDEIIEVYFFFIQYKQNAVLKHIKSETETLASVINQMNQILNSMPQNILEQVNLKNIQPS